MKRYECPKCRFITSTKHIPPFDDDKQPCAKCGAIMIYEG